LAFIDTRTLPDGHEIEADLCVIGSGAAGLVIAQHFFGRSRRVVVLESGGMELEPEIQSLYAGRVVGQIHAPLDVCRLRYFGGTTNHWTAHVRPLEPLDFESRRWIPHSGWPFGRSELDPYYEQARKLLGLPEGPFDPELQQRRARTPLQVEGLVTRFRRVIPEEHRRLGPMFRAAITEAKNVDVLLHANVLAIELGESLRNVERLRIGTLSGKRLVAKASRYVLAAGGIENPRILLLSGIGAGEEGGALPVGRFYANHPSGWGAYVQPTSPRLDARDLANFARPGGWVYPFVVLSDEEQRRSHLANCAIEARPRLSIEAVLRAQREEDTSEDAVASSPARLVPDEYGLARLAADMDRGEAPMPRIPGAFGLRLHVEPVPNPSSRVRLDDERDAFGQRRVALDWRVGEPDSECARKTLAIFARAMGGAGLGRVRMIFPEQGYQAIRTVATHHHLGTTRMHPDPKQGVVDENCKMHGIANLYVAGSSVFPTYGTANPTYTILALAFRLAEHLDAAA
jgi:choline dehydrogenase-like flavoprotein